MSEEKKIVELNDEELEKVAGGGFAIGDPFSVTDAETDYEYKFGTWFCDSFAPEFIYNVCYAGSSLSSYIANKYWYKNGEAWYCGTCSFGLQEHLHVTNSPKTVHNEFTYEKPF